MFFKYKSFPFTFLPETHNDSKANGLDKQICMHIILFSLKKEEDFDTCYNIDDPWRHYSKWNKTMTKVQIMYDSFNMRFWEQSDL